MTLRETVRKQVDFVGKTPGGRKLILHHLLDAGRDVFQFMQLFDQAAIIAFYYQHAGAIDELCTEDQEMLPAGAGMQECTKFALEKTLILIEGEIKNNS